MDEHEQAPASVGERITLARERAGRSQTWLAAQVGVSRPTISFWESGARTASVAALAALAGPLQEQPEWLAYGVRRA